MFKPQTTRSEVHSQGAPAFNKARLETTRSEVHSSVHQRLIRRVTREKGLTRPDDASPKNARGVGPKCSGPSLHERAGRTRNSVVVCDCERHALGAGRQLASAKRDVSQRSIHKETAAAHCTCTISCAVHIRTPTQPHVVTLHETFPAHYIPKVVRMEIGEVINEKVYASPRPPPKISLKHDWMKELFRSCSTTRGTSCSTIQKFPIKPTESKPRS